MHFAQPLSLVVFSIHRPPSPNGGRSTSELTSGTGLTRGVMFWNAGWSPVGALGCGCYPTRLTFGEKGTEYREPFTLQNISRSNRESNPHAPIERCQGVTAMMVQTGPA